MEGEEKEVQMRLLFKTRSLVNRRGRDRGENEVNEFHR